MQWTPVVRRSLLLLAVSCSMEAFAYTICVPYLTTYLRAERGTSMSVASLVFTSYTLGSVCVTPLVQRAILVSGGCSHATAIALLVLASGELLSIAARAPVALFVVRFIAGMAGGLVWSSVLSACSILAAPTGSMALMFGAVLSAVSIGTMSGPAIGGLLFQLGGWPLPFIAVGAACTAIALCVLALLEPLPLPAKARRRGEVLAPPAVGRGASAHGGRSVPLLARTAPPKVRPPYARGAPALVLLSVAAGALVYSSIDSVLPMHIEDVLRAQAAATPGSSHFVPIGPRAGGPAATGAGAGREGNGIAFREGGPPSAHPPTPHASAAGQTAAVAVRSHASGPGSAAGALLLSGRRLSVTGAAGAGGAHRNGSAGSTATLRTSLVFFLISVRPLSLLRCARHAGALGALPVLPTVWRGIWHLMCRRVCRGPTLTGGCSRPRTPSRLPFLPRCLSRTVAAQLCYGGLAPLFGRLASSDAAALAISTGGALTLAVLVPLFSACSSLWQLCLVAVLYGAAGTAQLTPTSLLFERAVLLGDEAEDADADDDEECADKAAARSSRLQPASQPQPQPQRQAHHPSSFLYALFNCAYVSGMALGPSVLAFLVDHIGFRAGSTVLALSSALVMSAIAIALSRELNRQGRASMRHGPMRCANPAASSCEAVQPLVAAEVSREHSEKVGQK